MKCYFCFLEKKFISLSTADLVHFYTPPHDSGGVLWCHVSHSSVCISFPDDKSQWIFTKLGMCIDIVELWFGTVRDMIIAGYYC